MLSELIQRYVDPSNSTEIQKDAFADIESSIYPQRNEMFSFDSIKTNNITCIEQLIPMLDRFLTSDVDKERHRSTLLLSELIHQHQEEHSNIAKYMLNMKSIELFVVFFNNRLSDYPSIIPSLYALIGIFEKHISQLPSDHDELISTCVINTFKCIDNSLHVQGLAQSIRQKVYQLYTVICNLIQQRIELSGHENNKLGNNLYLQTKLYINNTIIPCFCNAAEGEKDPRCLYLVMKTLSNYMHIYRTDIFVPTSSQAEGGGDVAPQIAMDVVSMRETQESIDKLAERVYNIVACYFPITFVPPPDDPFKVSTQMLVDGLQSCLTGHPRLYKHVIPFLMDQMTESYANVEEPEAIGTIVHVLNCLLEIFNQNHREVAGHALLIEQLITYQDPLKQLLFNVAMMMGQKALVQQVVDCIASLCRFIWISGAAKGCGGGCSKSECGCVNKTCCKEKKSEADDSESGNLWNNIAVWYFQQMNSEIEEEVGSVKTKASMNVVIAIVQSCHNPYGDVGPGDACNLMPVLEPCIQRLLNVCVLYFGPHAINPTCEELLSISRYVKAGAEDPSGCCSAGDSSGGCCGGGSSGGCCGGGKKESVYTNASVMSACKGISLLLLATTRNIGEGGSTKQPVSSSTSMWYHLLSMLLLYLRSSEQSGNTCTGLGADFVLLSESVHTASNMLYCMVTHGESLVPLEALIRSYFEEVMKIVLKVSDSGSGSLTLGTASVLEDSCMELVASVVNVTELHGVFDTVCVHPLLASLRMEQTTFSVALKTPSASSPGGSRLVSCLICIAKITQDEELLKRIIVEMFRTPLFRAMASFNEVGGPDDIAGFSCYIHAIAELLLPFSSAEGVSEPVAAISTMELSLWRRTDIVAGILMEPEALSGFLQIYVRAEDMLVIKDVISHVSYNFLQRCIRMRDYASSDATHSVGVSKQWSSCLYDQLMSLHSARDATELYLSRYMLLFKGFLHTVPHDEILIYMSDESGGYPMYKRLLELKTGLELENAKRSGEPSAHHASCWSSLCDCMYLLINKLPSETESAIALNYCCANLYGLFSDVFKNSRTELLDMSAHVLLFLSVCKGLFIRPNCNVLKSALSTSLLAIVDSSSSVCASWQDVYMNLITSFYITNTSTGTASGGGNSIRACISTNISTIIDVDMETYPVTEAASATKISTAAVPTPIRMPRAVLRSILCVFPMYRQKLWCKLGLTLLECVKEQKEDNRKVELDCLLAVCTLATYVPSSVLTSTSSNTELEQGDNTLMVVMQCIVVSLQNGASTNSIVSSDTSFVESNTICHFALLSRALSLLLATVSAPLIQIKSASKTHSDEDASGLEQPQVNPVVRAVSLHLHTLVPLLLDVSELRMSVEPNPHCV